MHSRARQIYWLDKCPPLDGLEVKRRPVVVMEAPRYFSKDFARIVACTTHPRQQDPREYEIPQTHDTGLRGQCWAIPRWYLFLNPQRLTEHAGNCPDELFDDLLLAMYCEVRKAKALL